MITNKGKQQDLIHEDPNCLILVSEDHKGDVKIFRITNQGFEVEPVSEKFLQKLKKCKVLYPARYYSIDRLKLDDIIE